MSMLIDTHCHLNHERLRDESDDVVQRAMNQGVTRMIVVGYDVASSEEAVRLAERLPGVYATVGVHPHDARNFDARAETRIRELAGHPRVVAIGEIGLDFHYDFSPMEAQRDAWNAQLTLARRLGLPVVVHCREAYADVLDTFENARDDVSAAVMHCWAGTVEEAARSAELGLYLGFGGLLTFKTAETIRQAAAAAPADRLLLETDAPYLAPVPYRGKRCEPSFVTLAAKALATVRGTTIDELADVTTANALRLFSKLD